MEVVKNCDREWRDRNPNWKDGEKDRHVPPNERQKPMDSKGGWYDVTTIHVKFFLNAYFYHLKHFFINP